MPKFNVYAKVVGSTYLGEYEADNEDEATKRALKINGFVSLCYSCTNEIEDPEIIDPVAELVEDSNE